MTRDTFGSSFFRPCGAGSVFDGYPRLAPWAAFFRRFAAGLVCIRQWGRCRRTAGSCLFASLTCRNDKVRGRTPFQNGTWLAPEEVPGFLEFGVAGIFALRG